MRYCGSCKEDNDTSQEESGSSVGGVRVVLGAQAFRTGVIESTFEVLPLLLLLMLLAEVPWTLCWHKVEEGGCGTDGGPGCVCWWPCWEEKDICAEELSRERVCVGAQAFRTGV